MKQILGLTLVLAVVWIIWSGYFKPLLLAFGLLSVVLVVFFVARMGLMRHDSVPLLLPLFGIRYGFWLIVQIAKANLALVRRILDPNLGVDPRVIRFKPSQSGGLGRMIHANSITLTPGTVSIDVEGDELVVHALTEDTAQGVLGGEMDRRISSIRGVD